MIEMFRNLKKLLGDDIKKLYSPVILSIVDAVINGFMSSMMILVLIDLLSSNYTADKVMLYTIILVVLFIIRCIVQATAFTQAQCRTADIALALRLRVGNHIRNLNLGYFNKNSIGSLSGTLITDINDFEMTLGHSLSDLIKTLIFLFFSLGLTLILDIRYAIVIVVIALVSLPFLTISGKISSQDTSSLRITKQNVVTNIVEYITGIKTFRLYKLTGTKFENLNKALEDLKNDSIKAEIRILPYTLSFMTIASFIVPAALLVGTYILFTTDASDVNFLAVVLLSTSISGILATLGSLYPQIRFLNNSTKNLLKVLDEKPFEFKEKTAEFKDFSVDFKNVSFRYTDKIEVLKEISFTAKSGTTTALVGQSGSGKTTIVSLISRFWDVNNGEISIGEQDIKQLSPDKLTSHISVVFQDVYLLNDTIKNNIRIGKQSASDEEITRVAQLANCHEFIMDKKQGYDTMVGEGGATLSGGEKQRISIARALLKDAPIVLLDETTSSLDADNEKEIQEAFEILMSNKTVFVIAHRLNTIINADNILVLDNGIIKEQGNHKELIAQNGWYSKMYAEQRRAKKWKVKGN